MDIQKLLVELYKQRVLDSKVQLLFEFEAYFNQVFWDINLKKTYNTRLHQTRKVLIVAWDLSGASEK